MRARGASVSRLSVAAGVAALCACTFSSEVSIHSHELMKPLPGGFVNSYNVEQKLDGGFVPEVLEFLLGPGGRSVEKTMAARLLGRALMERGDFRAAHTHLERAYAQEGRLSLRADTAWFLSQCDYWNGRFAEAARWARIAQSDGRRIPDGWITFLLSGSERGLYGGAAAGTRLESAMTFGNPNLVRLKVRVNDTPEDLMVLDSGASISLLTESAARDFAIDIVPDATAGAFGLHNVEIPLRFGWARKVEVGGTTLTNVPFGILPDEALSFQTASAGKFHLAGVLGAHFMKEFDWRLGYREKVVQAVRLEANIVRGSKKQNLFFRRLKPMVRTSFNQEPWFFFLFDTGSEPTMVTRTGLNKARTKDMESNYPMTLEGIGKSRVSWGKMSNATVGIDRYMVRFKDIVVKEENSGIEDGVLGSSFLSRFDVEVRFGAMTVTLESPLDRLQRLESASEPAAPRTPRG
ncbi:MAG: aspartyl protease family protein [Thermoanaerobaculia bacterium]